MRPSPAAGRAESTSARAGRRLARACLLLPFALASGASAAPATRVGLDVPVVVQERERCGPAALEMVLRHYGAGAEAVREAQRAYDPALLGSLITDLATAARRAGFDATVATLAPDSLAGLLGEGVPPIVLYQAGRAPVTSRHFAVVVAWDPARGAFTLHDGGARPRVVRLGEFAKRWRTAGSQALVVRRSAP